MPAARKTSVGKAWSCALQMSALRQDETRARSHLCRLHSKEDGSPRLRIGRSLKRILLDGLEILLRAKGEKGQVRLGVPRISQFDQRFRDVTPHCLRRVRITERRSRWPVGALRLDHELGADLGGVDRKEVVDGIAVGVVERGLGLCRRECPGQQILVGRSSTSMQEPDRADTDQYLWLIRTA